MTSAARQGQVVSVLAPNVPCMLEAHYGVPMIGAVLHSINTRLDAAAIAYMFDHAQDTEQSHRSGVDVEVRQVLYV